jgi:hypothetical protein
MKKTGIKSILIQHDKTVLKELFGRLLVFL